MKIKRKFIAFLIVILFCSCLVEAQNSPTVKSEYIKKKKDFEKKIVKALSVHKPQFMIKNNDKSKDGFDSLSNNKLYFKKNFTNFNLLFLSRDDDVVAFMSEVGVRSDTNIDKWSDKLIFDLSVKTTGLYHNTGDEITEKQIYYDQSEIRKVYSALPYSKEITQTFVVDSFEIERWRSGQVLYIPAGGKVRYKQDIYDHKIELLTSTSPIRNRLEIREIKMSQFFNVYFDHIYWTNETDKYFSGFFYVNLIFNDIPFAYGKNANHWLTLPLMLYTNSAQDFPTFKVHVRLAKQKTVKEKSKK